MAILQKPSWWVAAFLFGLHQLAQHTGISHWLLDAYLDPLLFLPILLGLWLAERRWLFGVGRLSSAETAIAGVVLILLVEIGFPRLHGGFTHDWWDYPAYFLGLAYFWFFINPEKNQAPLI